MPTVAIDPSSQWLHGYPLLQAIAVAVAPLATHLEKALVRWYWWCCFSPLTPTPWSTS